MLDILPARQASHPRSVPSQIRLSRDVRSMSVISPKAAVMRTSSFSRFLPIADIIRRNENAVTVSGLATRGMKYRQ